MSSPRRSARIAAKRASTAPVAPVASVGPVAPVAPPISLLKPNTTHTFEVNTPSPWSFSSPDTTTVVYQQSAFAAPFCYYKY